MITPVLGATQAIERQTPMMIGREGVTAVLVKVILIGEDTTNVEDRTIVKRTIDGASTKKLLMWRKLGTNKSKKA